jgi:hypothetical protein
MGKVKLLKMINLLEVRTGDERICLMAIDSGKGTAVINGTL